MDTQIEFSGISCILLAIICLVLPLDWVISVFFAAAFHELCHLIVVLISAGYLHRVRIGILGAVMEASFHSKFQEFFSILAGPLGSFMLFFLKDTAPKVSACGVIHGLYNSLPIYPLDGGRILYLLMHAIFPPTNAEKLIRLVENASIAVILIFLFLTLASKALPGKCWFFLVFFLLAIGLGKKSCKET